MDGNLRQHSSEPMFVLRAVVSTNRFPEQNSPNLFETPITAIDEQRAEFVTVFRPVSVIDELTVKQT